jgi:hypothetical protein
VGESRGKRSRKTRWQLKLGIKELIFTALGVAGLAMMSFALGTLAGRGDIYRVLHNWGVLSPDRDTVQMWGQAPSLPATPVAPLASRPGPEIPAPQASSDAQPPKSPPVVGDIAALPKKPSHAEKKKSSKQTAKAKTDNLEKIRREVASKLKFQNSLDLASTRRKPPAGEAKKGTDKNAVSRTSTSLMVVAKFRNVNHAQLKLAQMRKQGEKVVLKEGKDADGRYFAICRQVTVSAQSSPITHTRLKKTKPENKPGKSAAQ